MIDRDRFVLYHGRSNEEVQACREYVKIWWPEEMAARLETADQVCENKFIFNLPWDMEQTAEIVAFGEALDWTYMPGKDVEFVYQMNRHRYWVCLGQAYAITGRERYVKTFVSQMADWIWENAITTETMQKTWRTIEAGIRAENWIKAMGYMIKSPHITDEVLEAFTESMLLHAQYLAENRKSFSTKSNWGILESSGLFAIGKMLEECTTESTSQRGREYALLALERLEKQLATQVMSDGVHWEQSPMYHNEVLRCCLEVLRLAEIYRMEVPAGILSMTKAMAYADRFWQKPDGTQLAGGDSDSTDIRDILTASAFQFKDSILKSGAFPRLDYESIWDYGQVAALTYEALGAPDNYRLIIDCLLNMPLLFWASEVTGDAKYADHAKAHIKTAMQYIVRPDYSTYHTYFFNPETGEPVKGVTHQGHRHGSAWTRGQAWGIYGSAMAYRYIQDVAYQEIFEKVTEYFLLHLPSDLIPYWDFDFDDGSTEPRDSSSAAIAACGMLEMARHMTGEKAQYYEDMAKRLLLALRSNCAVTSKEQSNGLLLHGTYARKSDENPCANRGVDECNTWGDYYYLEGLVRIHRDWKSYW